MTKPIEKKTAIKVVPKPIAIAAPKEKTAVTSPTAKKKVNGETKYFVKMLQKLNARRNKYVAKLVQKYSLDTGTEFCKKLAAGEIPVEEFEAFVSKA